MAQSGWDEVLVSRVVTDLVAGAQQNSSPRSAGSALPFDSSVLGQIILIHCSVAGFDGDLATRQCMLIWCLVSGGGAVERAGDAVRSMR